MIYDKSIFHTVKIFILKNIENSSNEENTFSCPNFQTDLNCW